MSKEMICPFCQTELDMDIMGQMGCPNGKCKESMFMVGTKELWDALIQSQRDLGNANEEIETLKQNLEYEKEQNKCWEHNYSVKTEQHERGYEYAVKTINRLESDLQIAKQALKKYASKGDWGDAMDENGCWINDSQFYANGYTVAETAFEQITHDNKN